LARTAPQAVHCIKSRHRPRRNGHGQCPCGCRNCFRACHGIVVRETPRAQRHRYRQFIGRRPGRAIGSATGLEGACSGPRSVVAACFSGA
jgi:hypothetical protein